MASRLQQNDMTIQPASDEALVAAAPSGAVVPEAVAAARRGWLGAFCIGFFRFGFDASVLPMLVLAVVGYFGWKAWLFDMTNFFRPHIAGLALLLVLVALLARSRVRFAAAAIIFGIAAYPLVVVSAPLAPRAKSGNFRVITSNVMGANRNFDGFRQMVADADPDIVIAEEAITPWPPVVRSLPHLAYVGGPNLETSVVVASRYPIKAESVPLYWRAQPQPDVGGSGAIRLEVMRSGANRPLVIYAIHPPTPRSARGWWIRNAYLKDIATRAEHEAGKADVIVAGDWNTPFWSPLFTDFLLKSGLRATETGAWPSPTRFFREFGAPPALGSPIDHVAVSDRIGVAGIRTGVDFGSDHLPVIVDLAIP